MTQYKTYFTDFTGNLFTFYMDEQGYGIIPDDLRDYLSSVHKIQRDLFTPSRGFIWNEVKLNIIEYLDVLISDYDQELDTFLDGIYGVCPCHKAHYLPEINYQINVTGSPYYLGGPQFNNNKIEPLIDTMRREVKEETFLTLYHHDLFGRLVHNFDMCFLTDVKLPYIAENTKLCVDTADNNIYGNWALNHHIHTMTSKEIKQLETQIFSYRNDKKFNQRYVLHKIALIILGDLTTLLDIYTQEIDYIHPAPHSDLRSNDFAVILMPLRLIYDLCKREVRANSDRRSSKNTII